MPTVIDSPLGKQTPYIENYAPDLLFSIPRINKRLEIGIGEDKLPFDGCDIWTGYELSWLNMKGKPEVAVASFIIPCDSPNIVESKSFKLYLHSFNQSSFPSSHEVAETLKKDLSASYGAPITVEVLLPSRFSALQLREFTGHCIDHLDIETDQYQVEPALLESDPSNLTEETLYSHLLKSNCLVTEQPDWGSVWIQYKGPQIDHESLLKYLISFRQHNEFHEQCIERIYQDIHHQCQPEKLSVYGRYLRRGGLDINPYRSNWKRFPENFRLFRQ